MKTKIDPVATVDIPHTTLPVRLGWSEQGVEHITLHPAPTSNSANNIPPKQIQKIISQLKKFLDGQNFELDSRILNWSKCTAFQKKVYKAAQKIPPGKTLTYSEIAQAMGNPKAVRAVGTALGKNPWPLIIPCHRVVAKNSLGGFSAHGGLTTKKWLLALENI